MLVSCTFRLAMFSFLLLRFLQIFVQSQATQKARYRSSHTTKRSKAFQHCSMPSSRIQTRTIGQSLHFQSTTTHHSLARTRKIRNSTRVRFFLSHFSCTNNIFVIADASDHDLQNVQDLKTVTVNCSVAFMSPCKSMIKW